MSKYDLSALQATAEEEIAESEKKKQSREGLPLVYPIDNGTFRIKLLYNPKAGAIQRKITRHVVGKDKIPCLSIYGEDCPICKAIHDCEEQYGKDCGAWSKYGYKTRGISIAILVDHEKGMFTDKNSPSKGDTILFMYPPTMYDKINEIIVKAGSHIENLVAENVGKTIEVSRKQKNGGFPDYEINVYAYGDEKVKETDEEFDALLDGLPDLNEQIAPNHPSEEILQKAKAAAETIEAEYASGRVLDPNNPPAEVEQSIKTETAGSVAAPTPQEQTQESGVHPACFGKHTDDSKCLICPDECDCLVATN